MLTTKTPAEILQKAYELSVPQGMGHYRFTPGPLYDHELNDLTASKNADSNGRIYFDYVKGRAVKLKVGAEPNENGETEVLNLESYWFDHTEEKRLELVRFLSE